MTIQTSRAAVPVTAAERDSAIAGLGELFRERGAGEPDWSKIPAVKPLVLSLFFAESGHLWVRTGAPAGLHSFDIYDPDGSYSGTAVTSLRLVSSIPPFVRDDKVWAVVSDDLGVQYVVRGRLAPYRESLD